MRYNLIAAIACLFFLSACGKSYLKEGESTVNSFYSDMEAENYKALDTYMSFRFYQGTPYKQFIEMLNKKSKEFGKIKKRSLGKYKIIKTFHSTEYI